MNPVELTFGLMGQWLNLTARSGEAAMQLFTESSKQMLHVMSPPAPAPAAPAWPFGPQLFGWGTSTPMASFGNLSAANPFAMFQPFGFASGTPQAWSPMGLSPWSGNPWAMMMPWLGAFQSNPSSMAMLAFPWMGFAQAFPSWMAAPANPTPVDQVTQLMEQATAAYRSASGFAVASVLGPMTAPGSDTADRLPAAWWLPR